MSTAAVNYWGKGLLVRSDARNDALPEDITPDIITTALAAAHPQLRTRLDQVKHHQQQLELLRKQLEHDLVAETAKSIDPDIDYVTLDGTGYPTMYSGSHGGRVTLDPDHAQQLAREFEDLGLTSRSFSLRYRPEPPRT